MARRKDVSAITLSVTLPARTKYVKQRIVSTATAWDDVVDGRLTRNVVVAEKRGAATPMTFFVSFKPQAHTSSYPMLDRYFHYEYLPFSQELGY